VYVKLTVRDGVDWVLVIQVRGLWQVVVRVCERTCSCRSIYDYPRAFLASCP
jgi:hypothetical protein